MLSFPLRGRGLKSFIVMSLKNIRLSFPLRGRGLKLCDPEYCKEGYVSFPLRGRGLKLNKKNGSDTYVCRSPCGDVD